MIREEAECVRSSGELNSPADEELGRLDTACVVGAGGAASD